MSHSRAERVGDLIRSEIGELLAREVKDPGIGFVTVTRVALTADLSHARIYYTSMADERGRRETVRALDRAAPFLRRQLGRRLRLKRVPDLQFIFDDSVEGQDRIERVLQDLHAQDALEHEPQAGDDEPDGA